MHLHIVWIMWGENLDLVHWCCILHTVWIIWSEHSNSVHFLAAPLVTAFECIQIHRQIKSHKLGKLILQNFVYEFKTWIPRRWKIKDSGLFQYICSLKCDLRSQFPLYNVNDPLTRLNYITKIFCPIRSRRHT